MNFNYGNFMDHLLFTCSVMSDSSWPDGLRHTRLRSSSQPLRVIYDWHLGFGVSIFPPTALTSYHYLYFPGFDFSNLNILKLILLKYSWFQLSSFAQLCLTLCDPMNSSMPSLPVHHHLPEFTQTHVHRVYDAIQPSNPLSSLFLLPPIPPSIRVFTNESTLRMRWP